MGWAVESADEQAGASTAVSVGDIVRDVVAQAAPEELSLVDGLMRFDDETVVRRLSRRSGAREPLGFGLGEIAVLVTPVVWIALDQAVRKMVDTTIDGVKARGPWARLRKRFRRRAAPPLTVPALTPEQIAEVKQQILELAAQKGLEGERAAKLADLVVATLSQHSSEDAERALRSGSKGTDSGAGGSGPDGTTTQE